MVQKKRTLLTELCEITGKVLIILSTWAVITSFIEADWWHFTDPRTTGFSIWAAIVRLLSICSTPLLLSFKCIRQLRLQPVPTLLFTLLSPTLLLLASIPPLGPTPIARTALLAIGVALIPLILIWILCKPSDDSFIRSARYCCLAPCRMANLKNRKNGTKSSGSDVTESSLDLRDQLSNGCQSGCEFLVAVLLSMTIRWCTVSLNVLYETWEGPCILLAFVSAYALPRFIIDFRRSRKDHNSRKSTQSTVISSTDLGSTMNVTSVSRVSQLNDTFASNESVCHITNNRIVVDLVSNHSDKINDRYDDAVISHPSKSCSGVPNESGEPKGIQISKGRVFLLWVCGIFHALAIGTLVAMFMWLFSSPSVLCRLSGKTPDPHGMIVLVLFALGVILSAIQPHRSLFAKFQLCESKISPNTKEIVIKFLQIVFMVAISLFLIAAVVLQLQGSTPSLSFVGSCMLCVVLPYVWSMSFQSVGQVVKAVNMARNCSSVIPGIVALIVALAFLTNDLLLVMFINPQLTLVFLGKMDIIYIIQCSLVCLSLSAFLLVEWFLKINEEESNAVTQAPSSFIQHIKLKFSPYKRVAALVFLAVVIPAIGLSIGHTLSARQCHFHHSNAHDDVLNSIDNNGANSSSPTFSVMSWNVLLGHDMNGRDNLPCLGEVMKVISPNLIGLQESDALTPYWGGKDILGYLKTFLGGSTKAYEGVPTLMSSLGVGILTGLNVTFHESNILPTDESSKLPHYSVTQVDCQVGTGTVHVFNLHAVYKNWTATDDNPSPFSDVSRQHVEFVANKTKAFNQTDPVIILGDFNLNPNEEQLNILHDLGFNNALRPNRTMKPPQTIRNRFAIVDHIFYRGLTLHSSRTVVETSNISDHHPILAYFEVPT